MTDYAGLATLLVAIGTLISSLVASAIAAFAALNTMRTRKTVTSLASRVDGMKDELVEATRVAARQEGVREGEGSPPLSASPPAKQVQ